MSKLDEIQERLRSARMEVNDVDRIYDFLLSIVSELKRIDAEQKSIDKVVRGLSDIHP